MGHIPSKLIQFPTSSFSDMWTDTHRERHWQKQHLLAAQLALRWSVLSLLVDLACCKPWPIYWVPSSVKLKLQQQVTKVIWQSPHWMCGEIGIPPLIIQSLPQPGRGSVQLYLEFCTPKLHDGLTDALDHESYWNSLHLTHVMQLIIGNGLKWRNTVNLRTRLDYQSQICKHNTRANRSVKCSATDSL